MTICFTVRPVLQDERKKSSMSSPGSTTIASRALLVSNDGAVALQRADRNDFVDHGISSGAAKTKSPLQGRVVEVELCFAKLVQELPAAQAHLLRSVAGGVAGLLGALATRNLRRTAAIPRCHDRQA